MESNSSNGSSSGGFFNSLGNFFLDKLDTVADKAIQKEFGEDASERDEGPGEFGNPNTVSQPVHQSQLPGGQSLNGFADRLGVPISVLIAGGGAVVLLVAFLLVRG